MARPARLARLSRRRSTCFSQCFAAAFEAIRATLPSSVGVEENRAPNGDYFIWLDPRYVDRLRALRGPGESYSDVIMRLARAS
jgi:hypothetical protein